MTYSKIYLKPGKEESLQRFHPWVFSGAIQRFEKQPEEGDIVEVTDNKGKHCSQSIIIRTHYNRS